MPGKKKKRLPVSTFVVSQHNKLVEAQYILPLSEQRLVLELISRIQPEDDEFHEYKIPVAEFYRFLGIDPDSSYRECKRITKQLLERVVEIQEPDRLIQTHWVATAIYMDHEGYVRLKLEPEMKPYLLQLKSNFTSCKLAMVLSFTSQYTLRVYALMKQYEQIGEREIEYQKLRNMLGLKPEKYGQFNDFRRRILDSTHQELIKKADLYFDYEVIRLGRQVHAIRFTIHTRACHTVPAQQIEVGQQAEIDALLALVPEAHRSKRTVLSALQRGLKQHGRDYVERNIRYANEKAVRSYAGFFVSCMKEDWGHDWAIDRENEEKEKRRREAEEARTRTPENRKARLRRQWDLMNEPGKRVWKTLVQKKTGVENDEALEEAAFDLFLSQMNEAL